MNIDKSNLPELEDPYEWQELKAEPGYVLDKRGLEITPLTECEHCKEYNFEILVFFPDYVIKENRELFADDAELIKGSCKNCELEKEFESIKSAISYLNPSHP